MDYLDVLHLVISVVTLTVLVITLRKVYKIHLATYDLLSSGKEAKTLFSQIQSLYALERTLDLKKPLPPVRGWAGSPDFLLRVGSEILARKPNIVMECSSGVSTVVIARCLQLNGSGHVYSLEHDAIYAQKTNELIAAYELGAWATVLHSPLETTKSDTPWYSEKNIPSDLPPIDLLVVDGPPATTAPMARFPALPRLIGRMASNAVVIADDTQRPDETRMIDLWQKSFPDLTATDCNCEKGCTMLEFALESSRRAQ